LVPQLLHIPPVDFNISREDFKSKPEYRGDLQPEHIIRKVI